MFRSEVQATVEGGSLSTIRAQNVVDTVVNELSHYGRVIDGERQYPTEPGSPDVVAFIVFEANDFTHAQELLQSAVDRGMQVFPENKTEINALLLR